MAKFTLKERPGTGIEVPDPDPPSPLPKPPHNVGDQILFIDRQLEECANQVSLLVVSRCTIVQRGMINTQGVIRFNDFTLPNGVTFAIVGGTRRYKKAHGTVTGKFVAPDVLFTFRVF